MFEYLATSPFNVMTPEGPRLVAEGEVLRLSSIKATAGISRGVLIEKNVCGLLDIQATAEARSRILIEKLQLDQKAASIRAATLIKSLEARHESLKTYSPPTNALLAAVTAFNRITSGPNPIAKIGSETGAGEWCPYRCNIGDHCSCGCLYCYAKKMAERYSRIDNPEEWLIERIRRVSTAKSKKYSDWIMFPTSHDISEYYLPAFRCHLYNILIAGNCVVIVTKPRRTSIKAICSEFSSFRDNIIFRFTIGGLDEKAMRLWEPGASALPERLWCLKYAFEQGFRTSISSEPMLVSCEEAEKFYYSVEPLVTEDIWFGKMSGVGGFTNHPDPEVARRAAELQRVYAGDNIMQFAEKMAGLSKVSWKDSIQKVIGKQAGTTQYQSKHKTEKKL